VPVVSTSQLPRCGVVDLGSNSVRLVIYEGRSRNPMPIFNEKAVLRLGRGLQATGRLNDEGASLALTVMDRYHAIARAMGATPFEVVATAAVRDASNGPTFVAALRSRLAGVPIHILSGQEEAALSAAGMLCGIPAADGILADIGGGSLELVRLTQGICGLSQTLNLGVIRLAERAGGDVASARAIVETDTQAVSWLGQANGGNLYLVGGAWRALARIQIARTNYPLTMVHHYTIGQDEARDLAEFILSATRKALERLPSVARRRIDDLPFASVILRRLLISTNVARVVFSANGLREGWFMQRMPPEIWEQDPLLGAGQEMAARHGRDLTLPAALMKWTEPIFPHESAAEARLREAACWMSDIGSHDHPEFRAEQAFLRVLRQPGAALDHVSRAFLALAVALRYEAESDAPFLRPSRLLLSAQAADQAEILGMALRLAYTLSAGTNELLKGTRLKIQDRRLVLMLRPNSGVFSGESVVRRLAKLADALGLQAKTDQDFAMLAE
jgi:exopolyphosphatase/guanosine-5'-triphosphate,3'-diphosphate pyrophosphatase